MTKNNLNNRKSEGRYVKTENEYNVLLVFDSSYSKYSIVLITNILENSSNKNFHFFLITDTETDYSFEEMLLEQNNVSFNLIRVNTNDFEIFHTSGYITKGAYYLLAAIDLIPANIDRLLYLDLDIYVVGDLTEIYKYFSYSHSLTTINNYKNYFGAGLLLINTKLAKNKFTMNNFKTIYEVNYQSNIKTSFMYDQELLNFVFKNDYSATIPYTWDFTPLRYKLNKAFWNKNGLYLKDVKSVHYPGTTKPWRYSTTLPFVKDWQKVYFRIYNELPWKKITFRERLLKIVFIIFPNPRIPLQIYTKIKKF